MLINATSMVSCPAYISSAFFLNEDIRTWIEVGKNRSRFLEHSQYEEPLMTNKPWSVELEDIIPTLVNEDSQKSLIFLNTCALRSRDIETKQKYPQPCSRPGSNRGPSACEADVITTTLRKHISGKRDHTSTDTNTLNALIYHPSLAN